MKKIVHVVEAFGAGVYSFITELTNSLTDEYEVVIVYSLRKETPKEFKSDFDTKIKFIKLDMCRGFNPYKNINSLFQIKKILKYENPDIVHLHSSKAGFLGRIACFLNNFDMNKVFYNPHGFSFLQQNETNFKRKIYLKLEKFSAKLGGCIIACSKGEYEEAIKISNKCVNIKNGIDTKKIDNIIIENNYNKEVCKYNQRITIGTVGRICCQKNPSLFNEIAKNFPQYDFIWIGDGELKRELTSQNIKITGWINRKTVIGEILKLDIFILTSLWEGLPISLLEAMYLGKPVIVSDAIGNRDVIDHEINGCIAKDINMYVRIVINLAADKTLREKFKQHAADDVIRNYNKTEMINEYKRIYLFNSQQY